MRTFMSLAAAFLCCLMGEVSAQQTLRVGDLCHVLGQETNTLQGIGLVVGLKGTGDADSKPMANALARMMSLLGAPVSSDVRGQLAIAEVEDAKNVALVFVTATVPAGGAQAGDKLNCTVAAISAKSLEGGQLLLTPLLGPRSDVPQVFALANGPIALAAGGVPTGGTVNGGAKMERAVQTQFVANDALTLVLAPEHASFTTAQNIEDRINEEYRNELAQRGGTYQDLPARAVDSMHVRVEIPEPERAKPVQFAATVLDLPIVNVRSNKRVVIREREGTIIFGGDIMIKPVAISHNNLTISGQGQSNGGFVSTSLNAPPDSVRLQELVDALNVLSVPTADIISIIKALKAQGNLYADLVIE